MEANICYCGKKSKPENQDESHDVGVTLTPVGVKRSHLK